MSLQDLPLLELFTRLRKADLPLGIDEYQLLLHSLQGGFGISDRAALKRLCRTLWVKSADDDRLLDYHFEQVMPRQITSEVDSEAPEPLIEEPETPADSPSSLLNPEAPPLSPPTPSIEATGTSEMTTRTEDEVRVAQTVLRATNIDDEISVLQYISSDEYFPVTRRQMKQSWRYLRRPIREGPPVELDVEATVNEVGNKGMLIEPVLVPRRINRAELLLLIDQGGSMVPFHMLSQRLIETAQRGGRLGKADVYYFHNCPTEYLYRDPAHQEYERIENMLARLSQQKAVLVFSDAGAARGGFSRERINLTRTFLAQFKQQFRYIVWLNPMPGSRWRGTTAGEVMQFVPMFDLSRRGLDNTISALRGHFTSLVQFKA